VPRERIHFEFFKAGPEPAMPRQRAQPAVSPAAAAGSEAVLIVDGVRKTVHVPPGGQIVDTAIKAGVAVPYSCKGGMCCTCRAKLIEGRVEMTRNFSLEQWEMDAGFVLACQSVPQTDRVVLSFDQM
jgi:ring-1,2-phenylacetyl-CoA epoxidase subunit PaaE